MPVSEKDREHFRVIARATAAQEEERSEREARRDPGAKMTEGLELADFGIRMGAAARGGLAAATSVPDSELFAQASLWRLWKARKRADPA